MKNISIVGVEGSGKTVMMAAIGEQWEKPDERGYFLSPENAPTYGFSKKVMGTMRQGRWPSATPIDTMTALEWTLRYKKDNVQKTIANVSLMDFAGEIYRLAFVDNQRSGGEYKDKVTALRTYVDQADVLIVLVNLSDIIDGSMSDDRTLDAAWVTKSVLDYATSGDVEHRPQVAIVFSQADSYLHIIESLGGERNALDKYLPHVASLYDHLPIFTATAVDRTIVDDEGVELPSPDFQSTGLRPLMDWIIHIAEQDKAVQDEKAEIAALELIMGNAPLVHLDVAHHKIQKNSGFFLKLFFCLLSIAPLAAVANAVYWGIWSNMNGSLDGLAQQLNHCLFETGIRSLPIDLPIYNDIVKNGLPFDDKTCLAILLVLPLVLVLPLFLLRLLTKARTKTTLRYFRNKKWTEAMKRGCFLFAHDGYLLYYQAACFLFEFGGCKKDNKLARSLFAHSARQGVAESHVALGWMADMGMGMSRDPARAKHHYDEARAMGARKIPEISRIAPTKPEE